MTVCNECGKTIPDYVEDFSMRHFGKPYCMIHQKGKKKKRKRKLTQPNRKFYSAMKASKMRFAP